MTDNHQFDKNLKRMLQSALDQPRPAFQQRLVRDVLAEVERQRRAPAAEPSWRPLAEVWRLLSHRWAAATCLALLLALGLLAKTALTERSMGRINCLYGLVAVQSRTASMPVPTTAELWSGQRILTAVGSKAEILLPDRSKLIPEPRTRLQLARSRAGPTIRLEQGSLCLEASKQPPGQAITIESSRAHIKVLGTRLEVRLVEKPTGGRQTRVRVLSGQVELESAGRKLLLPAGTEGLADEGQPPTRCAEIFEVGELIRLLDRTSALAGQTGQAIGLPTIIDLTTATVWSALPGNRLQKDGPAAFSLRLRYPAFQAQAYTVEGAEIPSTGSGDMLRLDCSSLPGAQPPACLILEVPGVGGLAQVTAEGRFACAYAGTTGAPLALVELLLPAAAQIESVLPAAHQDRIERDKLILTTAVRAELPKTYY